MSYFLKFKPKENLFLFNKNRKAIEFIFMSSFSLISFSGNFLAGDTHSTTKELENSSSRQYLLEILDTFPLAA